MIKPCAEWLNVKSPRSNNQQSDTPTFPAALFTQDAVSRIPVVNVELVGREEIRAGIERLAQALWDYLCPGTIRLEGDTASGRA
jgi:hypothetical protein